MGLDSAVLPHTGPVSYTGFEAGNNEILDCIWENGLKGKGMEARRLQENFE